MPARAFRTSWKSAPHRRWLTALMLSWVALCLITTFAHMRRQTLVVEAVEALRRSDPAAVATGLDRLFVRDDRQLAALLTGVTLMFAALAALAIASARSRDALRDSEARWQVAIESAGDGLWDWDILANRAYYSPQWKRMLGYEVAEIGDTLAEWERRVHPDDLAAATERVRSHVEGRTAEYRSEHRLRCKDGTYKWVLDRGRVIARTPDGRATRMIGTHTDISRARAHKAEIERLNRLYAALSQVNQSVVRAETRARLFDEVPRALVEFGGFRMAWIGWLDPETKAVTVAGAHGDETGYLDGIRISASDRPEGNGPVGTAIRDERACVWNDFLADPRTEPWRAKAVRAGLRATAGFPIRRAGVVCGALTVYAGEVGYFGTREVALLEEVASDLSFAIDHVEQEARRAEAEERLRRSERGLAAAQSLARLGSWEMDLATGKGAWSAEMYVLTGRNPADGPPDYAGFLDLVHPQDRLVVQTLMDRVIAEGRSDATEFRSHPDRGPLRFFVGHVSAHLDAAGRVAAVTGTTHDITERAMAERAALRGEAELAAIYDHTPLMMCVLNERHDVVRMNRTMAGAVAAGAHGRLGDLLRCAHAGPDPGGCGSAADCGACAFRRAVVAAFETGATTKQAEITLPSGECGRTRDLHLLLSIAPVPGAEPPKVLVCLEDVTERWQLQAQFLQAQKMEAVGQLAGGVAHDFNNMLAVIIGRVEMVLMRLDSSSPNWSDLQEVEQAATRSAELTRQLLAFARKQTARPQVLDLNDTVSGTLKMLRRLIGENIELTWSPGPAAWAVRIDPSQVDQVLANLAVNARDAIDGAGRLAIATETAVVTEAWSLDHPDATPGEYVVLCVADTGCGMSPDVRAHVFEPFFTTKDVGKGTGLGLATVYGIVRQNGGFIDVTSAVGQGCTFRMYLPRFAGELAPRGVEAAAPPPGGAETILVAEDEPSILRLAETILARLGYQVLAAGSADAALALAASHAAPIDLLLSDVVMPNMNGRELAERLGAARPEMRTLFMSGYPADVIARSGVPGEHIRIVAKPFTIDALAREVREALDAPARAER